MEERSLKKPKKSYEEPSITPKIQILYNTHYVFMANHQQLQQELESLKNPGKTLLIWQDHDRLEMYQLHIIRLLHNYLASAKTLIDHTRILVEELYENTGFWGEYEDKKKESFIDAPLAKFVQDLRHYVLHRALPFTSSTLELGSGRSSISLDTSQLRIWDNWSARAREYLASVGDSVRLDEVVDGYTLIVKDFYEWFYKRQKEIHFEW